MKDFARIVMALILSLFPPKISSQTNGGERNEDTNVYRFEVKDIDGKTVKLSDYEGKVLLIVNTASECGFTPQYEGLEKIYKEYKDRGFEILAFPCNDFGKQEPGSNEEIKNFCSSKFSVTFKLFDKIKVLGDEKEPLYRMLTDNPATGKSDVKWNFEKFLIDRRGNVVARFRSAVRPKDRKITEQIERLLEEK